MKRNFNMRGGKLLFLIAFAYIKRQKVYFLTFAFAVLALLLVQFQFHILNSEKSIRIGMVGTYQEHDIPTDVISLLSESLVRTDESNRIKPNMATSWETNNDATIFKFKLKNDLLWSDGTKIVSSDLEFGIPDVVVSYPDAQTIQFNLKEAYSPFPSLLLKPVFRKGTLIGTGPFKIEKIEKSRVFITKISMTSINDDLPKVYVRFYPSEKVAIEGFSLGEVEVLLGLSNINYFSNNPQASIKQRTDYSKIVTVLFSMADPLVGGKSRSLRQALSFITPQIKGEELADNPFPPTSWAYDKDSKKFLNNPQEAKEALDRAKSQMPKDKLNSEIILTSTPNLEGVAKQIAASWKTLGFDAKIRVESGIPQNFQALLIPQSIPPDPDQYTLWHATQTKTNISKVDIKRVDKDLEDGRKIINEDERKEKYFDFQKALLEEAPAIFLYFPKYNIVYLRKSEKLLNKVLNLH